MAYATPVSTANGHYSVNRWEYEQNPTVFLSLRCHAICRRWPQCRADFRDANAKTIKFAFASFRKETEWLIRTSKRFAALKHSSSMQILESTNKARTRCTLEFPAAAYDNDSPWGLKLLRGHQLGLQASQLYCIFTSGTNRRVLLWHKRKFRWCATFHWIAIMSSKSFVSLACEDRE